MSDTPNFLMGVAFAANYFLRDSVSRIDRIFTTTSTLEKVKTAATLLFTLSLALCALIPSTLCYASAACLSGERFTLIHPTLKPAPLHLEEVRIGSWNTACQDPWSTMTAGVVTPHQPTSRHPTRVAALVDQIARARLHVYVGQEWESLSAQKEGIERLQKEGFHYFLRDTGISNPAINNSGLFVASKLPLSNIQFTPFPFSVRSGLAKGSQQGALSFTIPLQGRELTLINTHLNYGDQAPHQAARLQEMNDYLLPILARGEAILLGDLNYDTSLTPLPQPWINALENQVTCSDVNKHILRQKEVAGCTDCAEKIDGVIYDPHFLAVSDVKAEQHAEESDHFLVTMKIALK